MQLGFSCTSYCYCSSVFFAACRELQVPHPQQTKQRGYLEILEHGTVPLISVPVCLMGFCGSGKTSLSCLLTGIKLPKVNNSTNIAVPFSAIVGKSSDPWFIRTAKMSDKMLAAGFKLGKSMEASSGRHPAKILGSAFDNLPNSQPSLRKSSANSIQPTSVPSNSVNALQTSLDYRSVTTNSSICPETILQILNCGGQPKYLEAIPLLVGPRCIYCIVYNLMWKLDDSAVIKFWKDGKLLQEKVSSRTYLEHVIEWISIIDCQFRNDQDQPVILFIGTHFDLFVKKMFKKDRTAAQIAFNNIFEQITTTVSEKLCNCKLHIKSFYVDNTTAGTSHEDPSASDLRSLISEIAMEYSTLAMPISWLCLLHRLQYASKKISQFAMHLNEVKEEADICGVKQGELQTCLRTFHKLSMLLYFHNIESLKGYVFNDINCFFQELGKIFMVSQVESNEDERKLLQRTGIVANCVQSMLFEGEFIKGFSLRVFNSLGLCGNVERGSSTAIIPDLFFGSSFSLLFFPSMIETTAISSPRKQCITLPNGKLLSPLFFVFSSCKSTQMQYTPPGFFTQLVSSLAESHLFNTVLDARDQPATPSYRNQFTFCFGKCEVNNVTIQEHSDCIQVTVEQTAAENLSTEYEPIEEICFAIREEIYSTGQSILQLWMPRISLHPCFFCTCCYEDHFAVLHNMGPPVQLSCTQKMKLYFASPQETIWLNTP